MFKKKYWNIRAYFLTLYLFVLHCQLSKQKEFRLKILYETLPVDFDTFFLVGNHTAHTMRAVAPDASAGVDDAVKRNMVLHWCIVRQGVFIFREYLGHASRRLSAAARSFCNVSVRTHLPFWNHKREFDDALGESLHG